VIESSQSEFSVANSTDCLRRVRCRKDSQGFSTAFTFKKFRDLLNLISLNVHFIQRCAKVTKKPVEMAFV